MQNNQPAELERLRKVLNDFTVDFESKSQQLKVPFADFYPPARITSIMMAASYSQEALKTLAASQPTETVIHAIHSNDCLLIAGPASFTISRSATRNLKNIVPDTGVRTAWYVVRKNPFCGPFEVDDFREFADMVGGNASLVQINVAEVIWFVTIAMSNIDPTPTSNGLFYGGAKVIKSRDDFVRELLADLKAGSLVPHAIRI